MRPDPVRDEEVARIFDYCRGVATLAAPEPWLVDIYQKLARTEVWSGALMRMLGAEPSAQDLLESFARRMVTC